MKVISIWNPYALLLAHGFKTIETRGWPAPKPLIGQRIGIASTKSIRPDQRAAFLDPELQRHYRETDLPLRLEDLPNGCLLGTVLLHSCDPITEEDLEDITEEELSFGWFEVGRFAWRCRDPEPLLTPVPVRGAQGVWELPYELHSAKVLPFRQGNACEERP